MGVKITTLVENKLGENLSLKNEHGLSFFIQTENTSFLFDVGQSSKFMENAENLNIDIKRISSVVISHGHYDHSGGLKSLEEKTGSSFELVVGSDFFREKYAYNGINYDYLGNNFDLEYINKKKISLRYLKSDVGCLDKGIYLCTNFVRYSEHEKVNSRFYIRKDDHYEHDDFSDEIAIVVETSKGLLVVVGCSHPGIVNIIETIKRRIGKNIYGIIGGTHLVEADDERLDSTIEYFKSINLMLLGISHCTGDKAVGKLRTELEGKFFYNNTGASLFMD